MAKEFTYDDVIEPADATKWDRMSETVASTTEKGLMSHTDKAKLNNIESEANKYTHPSTHLPGIIQQDANNRFVTDTEKQTWNAKAGTDVATTAKSGLMASTDKMKLDGVATGANNYTHPATHPAAIITQDANNRFMTDAERTKLTGIATGANNYTHPTTHPPAVIEQDTNNRFMTDTEKTKIAGVATGAQVNRPIASKAQAEAGADHTTDMTPLRVREAGLKNSMTVVNHGASASVTRPSGASAVYWIGTAEPTNAADNDLWIGGL